MSEKRLTEQQLQFVEHLARDPKHNRAKAARLAGYSQAHSDTVARDLWERPHVRAAYDALVAKRMERYGVTDCRIIEGLAQIAFGDTRAVLQWKKDRLILTPSDELYPEEAALVKRVRFQQTEDGPQPDVTFYSRQEALMALAKIKGLLRERVDVSLDVKFSNAAQWCADTLEELLGGATPGHEEGAPPASP